MDRWIHFNMAIVGGFLGGFAILNHHELFGSAQTSNLISVFADLAGHPDANLIEGEAVAQYGQVETDIGLGCCFPSQLRIAQVAL